MLSGLQIPSCSFFFFCSFVRIITIFTPLQFSGISLILCRFPQISNCHGALRFPKSSSGFCISQPELKVFNLPKYSLTCSFHVLASQYYLKLLFKCDLPSEFQCTKKLYILWHSQYCQWILMGLVDKHFPYNFSDYYCT